MPINDPTHSSNMKVVSLVLGHNDEATGMKICQHSSPVGKRERYKKEMFRRYAILFAVIFMGYIPRSIQAQEHSKSSASASKSQNAKINRQLASVSPKDRTTAKKLVEDAFELARRGENDQALDRLKKAYILYPEPSILFNIAGLEDLKTNNCRVAHTAFTAFIEQCGTCDLRSAGESRLERIKEKCLVELTIETVPSGATIFLDEDMIGLAPVRVKHLAGRVTLRAEHEEYTSYDEVVIIKENTPYRKVLTLTQEEEPPQGKVQVISLLPQTKTRIDGKLITGDTPQTLTLSAGKRSIEIYKEGYPAVRDTAYIIEGKTVIVDIQEIWERKSSFRERSPKIWPFWASASTAVVAAGVGTGFLIAQNSTQDDSRMYFGSRQQELIDKANREGDAGRIALSVAGGAALVAVGTWLWPLLRGQDKPLF